MRKSFEIRFKNPPIKKEGTNNVNVRPLKELENLNPSDKIFWDFGVEELQENTAWYI